MPSPITKFVRRTRLARRAWYGLAALAAHALGLVVIVQLVVWAFPHLLVPALWIAGSWLLGLAAYGMIRPGLSLGAADGALGLGDRLVTWWGTRQRPPSAARSWLEADLETRLQAVPVRRARDLWRRPARRLLWLLPLLLVALWIGPLGHLFYLPSPFGLSEQSADAPRRERSREQPDGGSGGQGSGAGAAAGEPRQDQEEPPQETPSQQTPPRPAPPPPTGAGPDPAPADEDPAAGPIPELQGREEFVIPDFIGAGSGQERITKVVAVEEAPQAPAPTTAPPPPSPPPPQNGAPPERREEEFQAARERALRSRLVPESERDFVRRYFDELVEPPR